MGVSALSQPAEQEIGLSRLGIVVAVTAEARSLVKQPVAVGEIIYLPQGGMLQISGIGPRRADLAARSLLEKGAAALLSWGSAGGLAPKLSPGSLILPRIVIASNRSFYYVDASWHRDLCNRLKGQVHFHTEPLAESATVVCSPSEKTALYRQTGAIGVDMESAAVAAVAREEGVPFMVVRAVADSANTTVPYSTVNAVDGFGRLNLLKLIRGLVKHPTELFALVRVGRNYRAAQRSLETAARLIGNDLLVNDVSLS